MITFSTFGQVTTYEEFYGNPSTSDLLNNIQSTNDGGYVVVGEAQSNTNLGDFNIVKFDENGIIEFSKTIGTPNIETANAVAILENGYAIGGSTFVEGQDTRDCFLVILDAEGNLLEETTFGGPGDDVIYGLIGLVNGDIAVTASYENSGTSADFHVRRYTSNLESLGEIDYDHRVSDRPSFIVEDGNSGNILVGGSASQKGFLMNFTPQLDSVLWTQSNPSGAYSGFKSGLDYNDDHYAIGINTVQNDAFIGIINKISGEFEELIEVPEPTSGGYRSEKIVKKGNLIYYLLARSNVGIGRVLIKYDFVNDSFSEPSLLDEVAKDFAVQDADRFAIIYETSSDVYKIDIVQELNENMSENWSTNVGDQSDYSFQGGKEVVEAESGFMYLGGEITRGVNFKRNIVIHKVKNNGMVIWESEINIGTNHRFGGITKTTDNGCLVAVLYGTNSLIRKLGFQKYNSDGTMDWFKEVELGEDSFISDGTLESNENGLIYYAGSFSGLPFFRGILFLKLDESSNLIEEKIISFPDRSLFVNNLFLSSTEEILLTGYEHDFNFSKIELAIKLDSTGEVLWDLVGEGDPFNSKEFKGATQDIDGDFLIADGFQNIHKVSTDGIIQDPSYLSTNYTTAEFKDICMAKDSSLYLLDDFYRPYPTSGIFNPIIPNHVVVRHYDSDLNLLDTIAFGEGRYAIANEIYSHSEGGVVIYGEATKNNIRQGFLMAVNSDGITSTIDI